ncbi:MAG: T9SS type A sorting domain-containing protein, partial [Saprospiraceae bacterium]
NNPCAGGGNPTCSDGMMNGDETGVDCGGSTCDPCATDPTCNDGMMNGNDTGVDCGGPDCRPCSSGCETMTLVINFDDYPDETYWEILQNGDIIESDGPYDELDPMVTSITKTMCLSNGCYEFIIYDDAEDGICCGDFGDGNYTLTNSSNQVMAQGGQFEDEESTNFCASAAAALPLSWLSFNVTQQSDAVYLTWETAAEINNTGFEIERSKDGNDWKNIGWQAASTASTRNATYSFVDAEPLSGLSYYRLAQIDQDGQQTWSEVRQARFSNVVSELKVYPNPLTTNQLSIDLPSSEIPATAIFTDQLGRVVQQTSLASGQQSLLLQNLPQGVYWLQVEQAGEVWMEKIVKY